MFVAWLWLAVSCCRASAATAGLRSEYAVRAWQTDEGLPQSSVKCIVQTPDGYLWLATFDGLARFDGVRFTVFDTANVPGLPSNRLVWLHADREGGLWLVTEYNELARLAAGRCQVFGSAEGLPPGGIEWIGEDGQGGLWVAAHDGGLGRLQNARFVPVSCPSELPKGRIVRLFGDSEGRLWLERGGRVACFAQGQFTMLKAPGGDQVAVVECLCPSRDGGFWMVTPEGLRKFRDGQWLLESWRCPDFKTHLEDALEDRVGNLWLATYNNGLFRFRPPGTWEHFTEESGLTSQRLRSLFCDREGNLWAGTDGGGLNRLGTRPWRMITRREGLGVDAVHSVSQDLQGRIWFGGGTTKPYWLDQGVVSVAIESPLSDPIDGVWAILPARDGAIWVGTYGGKVFRYQHGALTAYGKAEGMLTGSVWALLTDRKGAVWVGGANGLSRIQNGHATHFTRQEGLSSEKVRALAEDADGSLFVGTQGGGLNRWRDGTFTTYTRQHGLADEYITALYADAEGVLWIGTRDGGLSRFEHGRFSNFGSKAGLSARGIGAILQDDQGYLWLGSNHGIHRVSKAELNEVAQGRRRSVNCITYDRSDGLDTVECGGGAQPGGWRARDGQLWFVTSKGAAVLDPARLPRNSQPPPVAIEEVVIDDEVVGAKRAEIRGQRSAVGNQSSEGTRAAAEALPLVTRPSSHVTVPPRSHRVEFHYTGLSFVAPTKVRFQYWLEGFDPDWVEAGARRVAYYTGLSPGHYRFRVRACNNDSVWNETGASLGVVVLPAYYQTWWFRLLLVAAGVGLISAFDSSRLARLHALARLRGRIAGDLHDEIGSNLGGIILLSELTQQTPALPLEAQVSLQEINATAQRTASAMRDIVWFLNPDFDTLGDMAARMREFATTLLAGVDCEFVVPRVPSAQSLPLEFRRNVFFSFKEILHNIVKHAGATRVSIRLEVTGRQFTLRVHDNGRGFNPSTAASGHGLGSLRQRAADLDGQLAIESEPGKGTTVVLTAMLP